MKYLKFFTDHFWSIVFWLAIAHMIVSYFYPYSDTQYYYHATVAFIALAMTDIKRWLGSKTQNTSQAFSQIERTLNWNNIRGNTPDTLKWDLEIAMLQEELNELIVAKTDTDRFDALLDLKFVLIGSLGKMGLTSTQIVDGYEAVISANETKSATKNAAGKITKGPDFVGPEDKLATILAFR